MINFRYHLVSLVAVFLALSIGIIMGSTVIDRAIVDGLQNQIDRADQNSRDRKTENDRLTSDLKAQQSQATALGPHSVRGVLPNQTVYIFTVGNISDTARVEVLELLSVAQARKGGVVNFSNDFLEGDKSKYADDIQEIENVPALTDGITNESAQIMTTLSTALSVQAGGTSAVPLDSNAVLQTLSNNGALSLEETSPTFDPVHPVSFIALIERDALNDKQTLDFVRHLYANLPLTIGFEGSSDDKPSRERSIELLGDELDDVAVSDNIESPGGRATLLLAHAENLTGIRQTYGISSKAQSPAPPLQDQ
jgi:hypothetical protein